jgi:RNAse (barnase) inhibitor barstar
MVRAGMAQGMKSCILDGATLPDAAAVYRKLGEALHAPSHFGNNPDALWDLIGEHSGEPIEIVWRNSARSAARLGPPFDDILAVLERAAAAGRVRLRRG